MKKYRVGILSAVILLFSFVLCRFVFFDKHGMKSWPLVLFVVGTVIVSISVFFSCKYLPLFTSLGYPVAFAIGAIFQRDFADPTGAMTLNNMWIIWTIAFLCLVSVGGIVETMKRKNAKSIRISEKRN